MGQYLKFEYKNRNRTLIRIKTDKEILDKANLAEMKVFYRTLDLSRRDTLEWIRDLIYSYHGSILIYDGKNWIKFVVGENDLDEVFGSKVEDDCDEHLYDLECRFISDWLNSPMPLQNGHGILLPRFRLMWIAMHLYQDE